SDIKIIHRRSSKGRDLNKIFYHLGRNNKVIWENIVPEEIEEKIIEESKARYKLTAIKENVTQAFNEGLDNQISSEMKAERMKTSNFESFALIDHFKNLESKQTYILCGTGKFPSTWASILKEKSCQVYIADFNTAFQNKTFLEINIISPEEALKIEGKFIIGHSSLCDTIKWQEFLNDNNKDIITITDSVNEHQFI
ncbi:MAG: hypothetical protein NE330_06680, partial [Lentisphaeraceae bacterium]|nr:hypothetical protein [Lentisphaeraceae bacterium]